MKIIEIYFCVFLYDVYKNEVKLEKRFMLITVKISNCVSITYIKENSRKLIHFILQIYINIWEKSKGQHLRSTTNQNVHR